MCSFSSYLATQHDPADSAQNKGFERRLGFVNAARAVGRLQPALSIALRLTSALNTWSARYRTMPSERQIARLWYAIASIHVQMGNWQQAFDMALACIRHVPPEESLAHLDAQRLLAYAADYTNYHLQSQASWSLILADMELVDVHDWAADDLRCLALLRRAATAVGSAAFSNALDDLAQVSVMLDRWLAAQGVSFDEDAHLARHAHFGTNDTPRFTGYVATIEALLTQSRQTGKDIPPHWRYICFVTPWTLAYVKYWMARRGLQTQVVELPECFELAYSALQVGGLLCPAHPFTVRAASILTDIAAAGSWFAEDPRLLWVWSQYAERGLHLAVELWTAYAPGTLQCSESMLLARLASIDVEILLRRMIGDHDTAGLISAVNALRRDASAHRAEGNGFQHLIGRCYFVLGRIYLKAGQPIIARAHFALALREFLANGWDVAFQPRVFETERILAVLSKVQLPISLR